LFDRRGCLILLGQFLLVAEGAYALMLLVCWGLVSILRSILPQDKLILVVVPVGIALWCLFALGMVMILSSVRHRTEAARRRRFEGRPQLTDEEFSCLFPPTMAPIPADVRAELDRFLGRAEVVNRLLPEDQIRATCALNDLCPDDLDWAEFLCGLEARFGVILPGGAFREATVAELVAECAASSHAEFGESDK
jgi:hypothetical protein